jgi:thimet oligopeptidase
MAAGCLQNAPSDKTAGLPPPVPESGTGLIKAQYSPGEIIRLCAAAELDTNVSLNIIAAIPPGQRTMDNTLLAFDRVRTDYSDVVNPLVLMGNVNPDAVIAAEGMACRESSAIFNSATGSRRDLYDAMKNQTPRNSEESRLYTITIEDFEHNGLKLTHDRLDRVRAMKADLTGLEVRYMANLNNDNTMLELTADELTGLSAEKLASFTRTQQGTYLVTMKAPDVSAVLTKADRSETRKKVYAASLNLQAVENTALLEEAIVLRYRIAQELGYRTWADYKLDGRMAKNTSTVMAFLDAMKGPLKEKSRVELDGLLEIKKSLDPGATTVDPWDIAYLQDKQTELLYAYSEDELREYFPLDSVLQGTFSIYGSLFGIRFDEVKDAPVWSPEVRVYRVGNLTDNSTVGYLYLDLFPRQGKGPGYWETSQRIGRRQNGTYSTPVVVIVGNAREPEAGKPALLNMYEVQTLFHETGHAMHDLLTRAPYGTLSGTSVEWDFVETPSQTLEEWAWNPQVLESLSGHYTNTSQKIPKDLRDKVIASRNAGAGIMYSNMLSRSIEDMRFHTAEGPVNATAIYYETFKEVCGMSPLAGTHQPAQFDHLMDGYDAGYYGYLWSKVYALAIVEEFKKNGMTNRTSGMKFRQAILEKGNMEDGTVLLKNFLGREPGVEALYTHIGINVTKAM